MLLCTEDTLSRPMPHVYTMDPEDKTVAPVIDLDSAQESEDQSDKGTMRDVRVKDLRIIAQQQVPLMPEKLETQASQNQLDGTFQVVLLHVCMVCYHFLAPGPKQHLCVTAEPEDASYCSHTPQSVANSVQNFFSQDQGTGVSQIG